MVLIGLLLVVSVSAYVCINLVEDNPAVQEFKQKINIISIEKDLERGLTPEQINLKLKYFGPCNK